MLVAAGYLASTLWPKVVVVERKAVDNPPGAVGAKPGLQTFADLVVRVCPAIVRITAAPEATNTASVEGKSAATTRKSGASDALANPIPPISATGFLTAADGSVAAASRAIGSATSLVVSLNDGRSFAATRLGDDPLTGIALLKIKADGLSFLRFAGSSFPRAGEPVVAVSSPSADGCVADVSTIAADSMMVGDARANYLELRPDLGRSGAGAPVFNEQGRVIGIAGLGMQPEQGAPARFILPAGIGIRRIDAIQRGTLDSSPLGIIADNLTPALAMRFTDEADQRGAYIALVVPGSVAADAGARVGDVIISIDGKAVARSVDIDAMTFGEGDAISLALLRRGQPLELTLPASENSGGNSGAPPVRTGKNTESRTTPRLP
ncbi:S1C family serine protease [Sphingomonas oligophenolica]|uniref:PDZ domain-containing protein n=1 Tax=Sphingomonas oligophenolica TaxID=301154 RepID=A0A502C1C9_9SPHN|nr:trypsin-like peptidase domain-containing protein [Sphingomonas oligophenolica]TPG06550.1 PDZ domain-containing protein [Sphingomonas oligophenolica]